MKKKSAVLVASFGTSYREPLQSCIESTESRIHDALPEYKLQRAFTSEFVAQKLAKRDGIHIDNPAGALRRLKDEGFTHVVVQPLHILPGYEYHEVRDAVAGYERLEAFEGISLGEPLLYRNGDYIRVVEALKTQLPSDKEGEAVLLMGHGTEHFSNACYYCLQSYVHEAGLNVYIANAEGCPSLADIICRLKKSKVSRITLMPLMLVAGDHVKNDMTGDGNSWKTILENAGFEVKAYMHGLGENEVFRRIFVQKALKAAAVFGQHGEEG